jgi:hypothetical protein
MRSLRNARSRERGANLLEFGLVMVVLLPLVFGAIALGMRIGTQIQTTHLARDAAHMYARGVDFSKSTNQDLLYNLGQAFHLARNTGKGTVVFSQVRKVHDADCLAVGGACGNRGRHVVVHRLVFGDASLMTSRLATPASHLVGPGGVIGNTGYVRDPSTALHSTITRALFDGTGYDLAYGEVAYVVETFTPADALQMFGTAGTGGVYSRAIF